MEEKKAGILKLRPITFVNNENQEVKVIHQEKGKVKDQKIELQQKNEIAMSK